MQIDVWYIEAYKLILVEVAIMDSSTFALAKQQKLKAPKSNFMSIEPLFSNKPR